MHTDRPPRPQRDNKKCAIFFMALLFISSVSFFPCYMDPECPLVLLFFFAMIPLATMLFAFCMAIFVWGHELNATGVGRSIRLNPTELARGRPFNSAEPNSIRQVKLVIRGGHELNATEVGRSIRLNPTEFPK
ncbi:hypothetical protein ACFE04_031232 [Oxalis oulophora]